MTDYYAKYIAELNRSVELRCALAFIEGYTRVSIEHPDPEAFERHMTELHARAKSAIEATEYEPEQVTA
jgi:hypothetical protein